MLINYKEVFWFPVQHVWSLEVVHMSWQVEIWTNSKFHLILDHLGITVTGQTSTSRVGETEKRTQSITTDKSRNPWANTSLGFSTRAGKLNGSWKIAGGTKRSELKIEGVPVIEGCSQFCEFYLQEPVPGSHSEYLKFNIFQDGRINVSLCRTWGRCSGCKAPFHRKLSLLYLMSECSHVCVSPRPQIWGESRPSSCKHCT